MHPAQLEAMMVLVLVVIVAGLFAVIQYVSRPMHVNAVPVGTTPNAVAVDPSTRLDKIMATRKRHSPEQIVRKLMAADRLLAEGKDTAAVCAASSVSRRRHPTSSATSSEA
jgi:hypothetical protein